MDIQSYAEYVLENLSRATLVNALNITTKLGRGNGKFEVNDFCDSISSCATKKLESGKLGAIVAYRIFIACSDCKAEFATANPRSMQMVLDDLIIKLWEAINGNS